MAMIRCVSTRFVWCLTVAVAALALPWAPTASGVAAVAAPAGGSWTWPVGGPGSVVRGFQPPPQPWLSGHRGVDLRGSPGAAVRAAGAGQVSFAGRVAGKPVVVVVHAGGLRTTYEPVLAAVASGDEVAPGTVLGSLVATDSHCPPAACLHWGLLRGDTYLDPLALVGAQLQVRLLPVWGDGSMPPARRSAEGGHSPFVLETVDRIDPLTRLVRSPDAAERWTASAGPAR